MSVVRELAPAASVAVIQNAERRGDLPVIRRRRSPALVGLAVLLAATTLGPAGLVAQVPELRGRVTAVQDARAKVVLESDRAPATGSPAELYEVVDDLGEVSLAGSWSVAEIGDGFVWIATTGDAVAPQPGQFAKIRPTGMVPWRRMSESEVVEPVAVDGPWPDGATELASYSMTGPRRVIRQWDDGCALERRDGALFQRHGREGGACHMVFDEAPGLRDGRGYATTVTLVAGAEDEAFGLTFGAATTDDGDYAYYTFQIDAQGYYAVMLKDDGWNEIIPWTWRAEIRPGLNAPNRLALAIEGLTVRLFANGELLDVVALPRPVTGFGGFYVDEPGQTVSFDDMQIVELGGGGGK